MSSQRLRKRDRVRDRLRGLLAGSSPTPPVVSSGGASPSTTAGIQAAGASRSTTPNSTLLSTTTATTTVTDTSFKNAIYRYINELSPEDKAAFQSAKDVMTRIHEMNSSDSKIRLSSSLTERTQRVLNCINHFLGSISIMIQQSPEISSLVVGGVNCILHLVLGYIEFFESLTSMMERIGEHLNYLSKYGELVFQTSADVQKALVDSYCDLMEFFVSVRRIFANEKGRSTYLQSFRLFLKLTWEPFEMKFKPIEERFLHHTLVVVRSANVEHLIKSYNDSAKKDIRETEENRSRILKWLSPIDFDDTHQRHNAKHFSNTGRWLLEDLRFVEWKKQETSGLLWCHGSPGAGKTVLASMVVEHISALYQLSNDHGIVFLYCNYKEPYDAATYISVAIKQLCRRMEEIPPVVEAMYKKHTRNASQPRSDELRDVFLLTCNYFKSIFLILDALDECEAGERQKLFNILSYAVTKSNPKCEPDVIKLFVTSRREHDIKVAFQAFPTIEVEAAKVDQDIELYVTAQLGQLLQDGTLVIRDMTLKDKIIAALTQKAGGMFLWVEFQLQEICSQVSDHGIEQVLDCLPEDLEQSYDRILQIISKKPKAQRLLARKVLMWVAYAKRPLQPIELAQAVAVEPDTNSADMMCKMIPMYDSIFAVCANLVVLDSDFGVRFVHFSTQEYLLNSQSQNVINLNIGAKLAQAEMARTCMVFTLFCHSDYIPPDGEIELVKILDYPALMDYVNSAWPDLIHACSSRQDLEDEWLDLAVKFFKFGPLMTINFMRGNRLDEVPNSKDELEIPEDNLVTGATWYHEPGFTASTYALIFLPALYERIKKSETAEERAAREDDEYAMHYVSKMGWTDSAQRLLDHAYQLDNLKEPGFITPLCVCKTPDMARFLLDNGADINARVSGHEASSPLGVMLSGDSGTYGPVPNPRTADNKPESDRILAIVQLLLDRGANPSCNGRSPLLAAVGRGDIRVVDMLLKSGANVNEEDPNRSHGTTLVTAIYNHDFRMVQFLLAHGADVNGQVEKDSKSTALHVAAYYADIPLVELLLEHGADVNARGTDDFTVLHFAVGNTEHALPITKFLLKHGAVIVDKGGYYGTLLNGAAWDYDLVKLLLDNGADLNITGGKYSSAIQSAAAPISGRESRENSHKVTELLLDRGADVNAAGGQFGCALIAAVEAEDIVLVKLLLERGADVEMQSPTFGTAMHHAVALNKDTSIAELLLQHRADIHSHGGPYEHTLQAAVSRNGTVTLDRMLGLKKDIEVCDCQDGTMYQLHMTGFIMSRPTNLAFPSFLVKNGADINAVGGMYGTALQCAALFADIRCVRFLLDHGADVNLQGGKYGSALRAAALIGNRPTVELLLERGADPKATGGEFGSAAAVAYSRGNTELGKYLEQIVQT